MLDYLIPTFPRQPKEIDPDGCEALALLCDGARPRRALAFYRDVLDLEVHADVAIGSMRWLTVGSPSQPGGHGLALETPEGRPGDLQTLGAVIAPGR